MVRGKEIKGALDDESSVYIIDIKLAHDSPVACSKFTASLNDIKHESQVKSATILCVNQTLATCYHFLEF